ncbi:organic solute carrier partner 1 [Trypanosoma rangeli]|uniref:Organic solute carrier partner 1 n=1 Tax=Trypanosoma rangeli TaxID=5698 RepID=A0A3R7MAW0_TRYRA|nr:organic solute carrier partner 1 [Trypanosoma rangeli]RNF02566.1 organic solute carrier partner 1 [Trypanosoma rangeli]|eukprot:RNF02566.1 organic solute carrier partner 1 [Trypanosoma rangeli]
MAIGALPFLILNYGAEMGFILHTRLIAQNVAREKANTVMNDVVMHMFSTEFLEELFRPQPLYSYMAVKEVFKSLAETSLIHLSPVSMNKLFELMTMGVKYQVFTLRHPLELVEMTWTHLEELERLVTPAARDKVRPVFAMLERFCSFLSHGDLEEIRKELLNFLVGRNTLISVLINEGMQSKTGKLFLPEDCVLPPLSACEPPGSIRYFKDGKLDASAVFEHRDAALRHPPSVPLDTWDPKNPATRMTKNGRNMYAPSRQRCLTQAEAKKSTSILPFTTTTAAVPTATLPPEVTGAVTKELNHLSRLVGCGQYSLHKPFKLILFGDMDEDVGGDGVGNRGASGKVIAAAETSSSRSAPFAKPLTRMTKADVESQNQELFGIMDSMRVAMATSRLSEKGNDLLDIMDED